MRRLILGTAGHIDHGKTALVKALTGVDTDRLKEEKERGITVDLGFAELSTGDGMHFGVVDVPGHEGFIRNMLAGASGMDLVLLVVAADEGVMPQTREHLSILRLLGVPRILVALTKMDLVEEEWLALVQEEVRELLAPTPYRNAPILPVSARTGEGIPGLIEALGSSGREAEERSCDDLARLPLDRIFTIKGTGTVVTGTLWTGVLRQGDRVRILPGEREGRVRSLQVHGRQEEEARAGSRVAVGITGSGVDHHEMDRGQTLVQGEGWAPSWMLTVRLSVLSDTGWDLEQGQRVRVHLGTAEVLARAALMEGEVIRGGEEGWVQLRLESPLLARARDHLVVRSYSPVTTLGGGRVAEVLPRKRRSLSPGEGDLLRLRLEGPPGAALLSLITLEGWNGVPRAALPHRSGLSPLEVEQGTKRLIEDGEAQEVERALFAGSIWQSGRRKLLDALGDYHRREPLRAGRPLEELRQVLPGPLGVRLSEALIQELALEGSIRLSRGTAALADFRPSLTTAQEALRSRIREVMAGAGLAPPSVRELREELGEDVQHLLRAMEEDGELVGMEDGLFFPREVVLEAGRTIVRELGGSADLGPADFRETLPVTRKHLLPLLRHFDTVGITTRREERRSVSPQLPEGWGG